MVISFTGAQSTGKTTLLKKISYQKRFKGFKKVPEVTRLVKKKYGLDINEEGDNITQLAILNAHLENYLKFRDKNVVLDRCILDGLVYTSYLMHTKKVSEEVADHAEFLFKTLIDKVDIIFYTEADIPLVDDGERSVNVEFRNDILNLFELAIEHFNINVVRLSGTVKERIETINKTIDNYGK